MADSLTPAKAGRVSPDTSKVPSTQETVPEVVLRFYKKPLQVEVDFGSLSIDKKTKYGQIRKYQQKRVDEVKRSLMANPPEEPVTVTAWQSPGTSPGRSGDISCAYSPNHFFVCSRRLDRHCKAALGLCAERSPERTS